MHASVQTAWPRVAREHEGVVPWLYLDSVEKVTAGIGTLLDTGTGKAPESCLSLPWTTQGRRATRAEIASAWLLVKSRTDLAPRGGYAFRDVTTLRLDDRTIDGLLMARTREFWSALLSQLPDLEGWPADAQLALIDWSYQVGPWALGPKWPSFTAAAHSADFAKCAQHCSVKQANAARNGARIRWFQNAAKVEALDLSRSKLWDKATPERKDEDVAERLRPPYDTGDGRICSCLRDALPLVEYRFKKAGWIQEDFSGLISQWGYRGGATEASANTHNGGGVLDVRWVLVDSTAKLKVWLECGIIMFPRYTGSFASNKHGHGLVAGCPHLDPSAAAQITSYRNGYDGLANPSRYPGPDVSYRTWRRAQEIYADLIEEMNMPTLKEIADEVVRREYINNKGFAEGSEEGRLVSMNEALIAIMDRLRSVPDANSIAKAVEKAQGGEEAALNTRLANLEKKIDALAAAITPRPTPADEQE